MSLSINPASDRLSELASCRDSDRTSQDDLALEHAAKEKTDARKKKLAASTDTLSSAMMALWTKQADRHVAQIRQGDHHALLIEQSAAGSASATQAGQTEMSSGDVTGSDTSSQLPAAKNLRARILAQSVHPARATMEFAVGKAIDGATAASSIQAAELAADASKTTPGADGLDNAVRLPAAALHSPTNDSTSPENLIGPGHEFSSPQTSAVTNSPSPAASGSTSNYPAAARRAAPVSASALAPADLNEVSLGGAAASRGPETIKMDGAMDALMDNKKHGKDDLSASDAGGAGVTMASPTDTPLFTKTQEAFGGAAHKPATQAAHDQAAGKKSDNQGIKYTFNTWGGGNNFVEITGTAEKGYQAKASSSEVASILEAKLPTDGGLSLRIDAPDADQNKLQAVLGSTDSEQQDHAEE